MDIVPITDLINEFKLQVLTGGVDMTNRYLVGPEVDRPSLQLTGFFDIFHHRRLQILGRIELIYMSKLSPEIRKERLQKLFSYNIPCVIICGSKEIPQDLICAATQSGTPLLLSSDRTSAFIAEVNKWLRVQLAPCMTVHGVLVDVFGEGILIMGESGIGKSETALELVKRGHRLVADDAVEIKKVSNTTLVGSCPEITRHLVELRGIGIVDIRHMFGVSSIKSTQNIDLVIRLEMWEEKKEYCRMEPSSDTISFLDKDIACITIPVRPGRNLAIICESAAINHRMKAMGINTSASFMDKINAGFGIGINNDIGS
ncbi:MAG: HPr(Ser) kinase/phosphatase [Defluviitaleaceae bacterium]|nr:HPr(Ser) kinase/phosphatase [Defluviitaleaceae bacterium]